MVDWKEKFSALKERITFSSAWDSIIGRDDSDSSDGGANSDNDNDSGSGSWPPKPNILAPAPLHAPEEYIDVTLYHNGHDEAANYAAEYLERALMDGWGDQYGVRVTTQSLPSHVETRDDWHEYFFESGNVEGKSKDANVFFSNTGALWGGGQVATAGRIENVESLVGEPYYEHGKGAHYDINKLLHEVGHCLGLQHEDGAVTTVEIYDKQYGQMRDSQVATPMQTTYANEQRWLHRYSDKAKKKNITVQ